MASAAVDLADLVPDLILELNAPGADVYPTVSEEEWVNRLRNAFGYALMDQVITGYKEVDGIVTPSTGSTPLSREQQQILILYVAIQVVRNKLLDLKASTRAKAGSVEYEEATQGASVMVAILNDYTSRRAQLVEQVAKANSATRMYYINSFISRQNALNDGYTYWVGA